MYNHTDTNIEIKSDYPEHKASYCLAKKELSAFYNGDISDSWQGIEELHEAEIIYEKYMTDLESVGAV